MHIYVFPIVIQLDFHHQQIGLKRSLTNIELAGMDADRLHAEHRMAWRQFLHNSSTTTKTPPFPLNSHQQQQQLATAAEGQ
jgi:hypothetical protein